jgi:hypothetical protein
MEHRASNHTDERDSCILETIGKLYTSDRLKMAKYAWKHRPDILFRQICHNRILPYQRIDGPDEE